jgi:hypothetical protein
MLTEITRPKYERAGRRYASDFAEAECPFGIALGR